MASINILFSKQIPSNQGGQKHYNLSGIGSISSHQENRTPSFSLIKLIRKKLHYSFNVVKTTKAAVITVSINAASTITTEKKLSSNGHLGSGHLSNCFSSIPEVIEDIRQGKFVVVVDDEDRENEGDLIMGAALVKPEDSAFLVKYGTGIVCVCMKAEHLERLQLPLMVNDKENEEKLRTAFTITVDANHGTTTGVSAQDRTATILALASRDSKADDFIRPGHIFPLMYREGGVLKRPRHTEASVDLAVLAGLDPVAVICEIVADDGSMARLPQLLEFVKEHNFRIISIAELISFLASKQASENV